VGVTGTIDYYRLLLATIGKSGKAALCAAFACFQIRHLSAAAANF
jgi:hypothetical protein